MDLLSPYRVASYLLLFFSGSHTLGGLLFPPSNGLAADAVLASMKTTHFDFHGSDCTFYGFHMGFGLNVSVYLALSAVIAWTLGDPRVAQNPAVRGVIRPVAWALFVAHMFTAVLSWQYFFKGPGVFSTLITLLLGWECFTRYG